MTMAYDIDAEKMTEVLRIGREKLSDKGTTSANKRVDPVRSQTGMAREDVIEAFKAHFRGRYRTDFAKPERIASNKALPYRIALPHANHTFLPGHRIMVQIQSTWFPLYDRNPQSFVPNIMLAKPPDYVKATQRIWHAPGTASAIELPLVQ